MKRLLLQAIGWTALIGGGIAALSLGLSLIDPAAMQAANDADPLGTPPSTSTLLLGLVMAVAAKIAGIALVALAGRDHSARTDANAVGDVLTQRTTRTRPP